MNDELAPGCAWPGDGSVYLDGDEGVAYPGDCIVESEKQTGEAVGKVMDEASYRQTLDTTEMKNS